MKKAIVTGATGFIGKFLVRELVKQNVEVIAVVRRGTKNLNTINALPVKIVECNIADYHMLPDKFRTTMIRKAPRFVLCEVASVLHGVIIPEKNYKRMSDGSSWWNNDNNI